VAPEANPSGDTWKPGQAPSQALTWAVDALAKAGTLSIIGVYPEKARLFPIGNAVEKNLTLQMGNCPHRRYVPELLDLVVTGVVDPTEVLTQEEPLTDALEAYESFDRREEGWVKVMLQPEPALAKR
jgi:threonine dehydrogenase-like Zn-dependent dehydrogenase